MWSHKGLSEEVTFGLKPKGGEGASDAALGDRVFQTEVTVGAKTFTQKISLLRRGECVEDEVQDYARLHRLSYVRE